MLIVQCVLAQHALIVDAAISKYPFPVAVPVCITVPCRVYFVTSCSLTASAVSSSLGVLILLSIVPTDEYVILVSMLE